MHGTPHFPALSHSHTGYLEEYGLEKVPKEDVIKLFWQRSEPQMWKKHGIPCGSKKCSNAHLVVMLEDDT